MIENRTYKRESRGSLRCHMVPVSERGEETTTLCGIALPAGAWGCGSSPQPSHRACDECQKELDTRR